MLGVPVLAGSSAYAIAEAMAWRGSLDQRPRLAPKFYTVLAASLALGMALDLLKLDAVRMLFWSAVANGVLAPPLIVLLVLLTSDPKVMYEWVNPPALRWLGWLAAGVMTLAAAAMFLAR
jgi:Mn2+/Fe2+ NRAMP family transporter